MNENDEEVLNELFTVLASNTRRDILEKLSSTHPKTNHLVK